MSSIRRFPPFLTSWEAPIWDCGAFPFWLGRKPAAFIPSFEKLVSPALSVTGCALFAAMYNVTQQAAQGRGYAFPASFSSRRRTCCMKSAFHGLPGRMRKMDGTDALRGRMRPKSAAMESEASVKTAASAVCGLCLCLTGGLYAIPSNLYWVVSICLREDCFSCCAGNTAG